MLLATFCKWLLHDHIFSHKLITVTFGLDSFYRVKQLSWRVPLRSYHMQRRTNLGNLPKTFSFLGCCNKPISPITICQRRFLIVISLWKLMWNPLINFRNISYCFQMPYNNNWYSNVLPALQSIVSHLCPTISDTPHLPFCLLSSLNSLLEN